MKARFRELTWDWTEHTVRSWLLSLFIDQHDRVVIKPNVRAVRSPVGLTLAHHDAVDDILLLHWLPGLGLLDREYNELTELSLTLLRTTEHLKDAT